jgi:hypothetical protein
MTQDDIIETWVRAQSPSVQGLLGELSAKLGTLKSELATLRHDRDVVTVQRDAAMAACRLLSEYHTQCTSQGKVVPPLIDFMDVLDAAIEAEKLTPERAASVIEENERLRETLKQFADAEMSWTTFGDPRPNGTWVWMWDRLDCPHEIARQALEGQKGETNA